MNRTVLKLAAGTLIGLALLAWLLRGLQLDALLASAAQVPVVVWLMAAQGVLLSHALRAWRLRAEWRPRLGVNFAACLRLALLHNVAVLLLPLRVGEAGYAWSLHRHWQVPLTEAAGSLLWLRLQDLLVLALLAGLLWLPAPLNLLLPGWLLVMVWLRPARRLRGWWWQRLLRGLPQQADASHWLARTAYGGMQVLRAAATRRGGAVSWLCAISNWVLRLVVVGVLLAQLVPLPLPDGLRGALGGELGALLPLQGPAGLGSYEAGVWAGVQLGLIGAASLIPAGVASPSLPSGLTGVAPLAGAALLVHLGWVLTGLLAALPAALLAPGRRAPALTSV